MSTRTKSFFEKDHRKPKQQYWNNRRPTTNAAAPPPVAAPKPPIPATSQATRKLKAFQFVPRQPAEEEKKEIMAAIGVHGSREAAVVGKATPSGGSASSSSFSSKTPNLPHANTFPCTPGARLPLEDLIGNCDEPKQEEPTNASPQEQLGWIPNSSSDRRTPNRKRKRAKSSSPSCPNTSSQRETPSEMAAPSTIRKTPAADPVTDLWQRYASGKQNGEGSKLSDFNSIILQASPRMMETPIKSGPLRRWASTGNDWPSSKNKRQRTTAGRSIAVWQDQTALDSGNKSKVATMVQKMQEKLASQRLEEENKSRMTAAVAEGPSSSSPLPEVGADNFPTPNVTSPLQTRQPNVRSPAKAVKQSIPNLQQKPRPPSQIRPTQSGGIRFDSSRPAGDPMNPSTAAVYHLQNKAPLPAYKRPSITRAPSLPKIPQQAVKPPPPNDLDEFGDDDFNLTADDLDDLLSQKPMEQRALYDIPEAPTRPAARPPTAIQQQAAPQRPQPETITLDDDDEFGCEDMDEDSFMQAEFSATQGQRISPRKRSPRHKHSPRKSHSQATLKSQAVTPSDQLQRYLVRQVVDAEYTTEKGRRCQEKVLSVESDKGTRTIAISLRGSWAGTMVCKNDIIHVASVARTSGSSSAPTERGQLTISDGATSPFLIVHPDHMLSATTVADSFDCIRKAVLQDRIKATGETSKAMVYGKILHEIFQQALSANQWDEAILSSLVERTLQQHLEGLWELGMVDTNLAAEEVRAKMGELSAWASVFVNEQPTSESLVDDKQGDKVMMSISKLIAIEEHIWSPQFGLKGNVDATVQTTLLDDLAEPAKNLIVPFEVKTGRTTQSAAHRAQTALYTLLLSDRYDVDVEAGILYYLESSSMSRIAPPLMEVRQMIQQRNRLATYIFHARHPAAPAKDGDTESSQAVSHPLMSQELEESGLPALLKNPHKCGRCYAQQSCFTYHALVENGTAQSAGMVDDQKKNHSLVWKEAVGHLIATTKNTTHAGALAKWFAKWDKLLTFEERDQTRLKKELWTTTSTEREALGRCFGNLVLARDLTSTAPAVTQQVVDGIEGSGGKINRFAYVFSRATPASGGSFAEGSQLTIGEPVVVSSEQGQWALANGYVVAVARHEITVAVDRKLGNSRQKLAGFDGKTNQAFRGTMTVGKDGLGDSTAPGESVLYRLDKDEFSNGLALVRNNLVTLMDTHPIHTKLREQIIFGGKPSFTPSSTSNASALQPTQLGEMNEDQLSAVNKVLSANDYALILGMPGTGKTTTIAHIIRALLAQDKSILLTSFTHTAVDNILLKIRDIAPEGSILRLGVPAKINTQVQEFCQLAATPRKTIEEIEQAYMGTKVVATTCMGTNHALFHRRTFDVCIVDEASQITLPTILGPLLHARTFVLVGDHFQLPPLVQNKIALEGGLDVSLFRQLSEEQPDSVAALGRQYRMCEEIMTLSNELIYHGQLRCGSEAVANRTLQLRHPSALGRFHRSFSSQACTDEETCWLNHLTSPLNKVVYANTDPCGKSARETLTSGKNITNTLEATLSAQLVLAFLALGVPAAEIGVITLYRSQLALIRQLFKKAGISKDVEIDSADRFQGRDKECVILSMVRSNEIGVVGDLLKDWRRVNVALTRARSKLVVLGSRRTLRHNELLARFLGLVDERGWGLELPEKADESHGFQFSTQVTQELLSAVEPEESGKKRASPWKGSPSKRQQASPSKKISQASSTKQRLGQASPSKKISQASPSKKRQPLQTSQNAGNRIQKKSPKRISGNKAPVNDKMKSLRDQIVVEIWEDLTGEEF